MASSNSTDKSAAEKGKSKALQPGYVPWENASEHMLYMLAHPAKYTAGDSPAGQTPESENYSEALKGMQNMNLTASIAPADPGWLDVKDLNLTAWQPVNPKNLNPSAVDPHYARPPISLLFANNVFVPATDTFYTTTAAPWLETLARTASFTQQLSALRQHGHTQDVSAGAECLNCSCNQKACVSEGDAGTACVACSGRKGLLCGRLFVRENGQVEIRVVPLPKGSRGDALWSDRRFWVVE
jgi:hypothetical protein